MNISNLRQSILCVYIGLLCPLFQQDQGTNHAALSNEVSVAGSEYQIEWQENNSEITLRVASDGHLKTIAIAGFEAKGTIKDVVLSKWSEKSIIAVASVVSENSQSFICLSFLSPDPIAGVTGEKVGISKIVEINNGPLCEILAVNGDRAGDQLVVVLGDLESKGGVTGVTSGKIFIHDCPNPVAEGGALTNFKGEVTNLSIEALNKLDKTKVPKAKVPGTENETDAVKRESKSPE